jgi:hypothetical protein
MQESWISVAGIHEAGCRKAGGPLQDYVRLYARAGGQLQECWGSWTIAKGQLQDVLRLVEVKLEGSCRKVTG